MAAVEENKFDWFTKTKSRYNSIRVVDLASYSALDLPFSY